MKSSMLLFASPAQASARFVPGRATYSLSGNFAGYLS